MIRIKDAGVLASMMSVKAHPTLTALVCWVADRGIPVVITCAFELRGEISVHSVNPYRGLDIRTRDGVIDDPEAVCEMINKHWIYDPQRPEYKCAVYHDTGRGPHIHLQVHDRTEFVGYQGSGAGCREICEDEPQ